MSAIAMSNSKPGVDEDLRWVRPPSASNLEFQPFVFPETIMEKAKRKTKANPIVPFGVLATCAALVYGLVNMRRGNTAMSQNMMRARVAAQGFTIASIVLGVMYAGSAAR